MTCPSTFVEPVIDDGKIVDHAVFGCTFDEGHPNPKAHYDARAEFGWIGSHPGSWTESLSSGVKAINIGHSSMASASRTFPFGIWRERKDIN